MSAAKVVVGVDLGPAGRQALRRAVAEARARRLPLHVVRAWQPDPPHLYLSPEEQWRYGEATATEVIDKAFAETMGGTPADLRVCRVLAAGPAGVTLTEQVSGDDLLVLGGGRRRRWQRLSQTVRYCLAHAACPVLVVPPPALALAGSPRALRRELLRDLDRLNRRS